MSGTPNSDHNDLNTRLDALEHSHARMKEAFPQNSLKLPDYDGHRVAHEQEIAAARVVEAYKGEATKKVIGWTVAGLLGLLASGAVSKIGGLFK